MKIIYHILCAFILFSCVSLNAIAQSCTPVENSCTPGTNEPMCWTPDGNSMPAGRVGEYYDRVIQMQFAATYDTTVNGFTVTGTFQRAVVLGIDSLPAGLDWKLVSGNPADSVNQISPFGSHKGYACVRIFGTPTQANTPANNKASVNARVFGEIFGIVGSVPIPPLRYRFPIDEANGRDNLAERIDFKLAPNPSNGFSRLTFNLAFAEPIEILIFDLSGKQVWKNAGVVTIGENSVEMPKDLNSGLYIVQLKTSNQSAQLKWICQ